MTTRLREEIANLKAVLEVSVEPMQRALDRMTDAQARGGWNGMIDATMRRIEATKDYAKLQGIQMALERMLKDMGSEGAPARVARLKQLLVIVKDKLD